MEMGLCICAMGAVVFHPPESQRGLRAKKLKSMVLKGAEKVKKFKQMKISLTKG